MVFPAAFKQTITLQAICRVYRDKAFSTVRWNSQGAVGNRGFWKYAEKRQFDEELS